MEDHSTFIRSQSRRSSRWQSELCLPGENIGAKHRARVKHVSILSVTAFAAFGLFFNAQNSNAQSNQDTSLDPPVLSVVDQNAVNLANRRLDWRDLSVSIGNAESGLSVRAFVDNPGMALSNATYLNIYYNNVGNNQGPIIARAVVQGEDYIFVIGGGSAGYSPGTNYDPKYYATSIAMQPGPYNEFNHNGEMLSCTGSYQNIYAGGTCTLYLNDGTLVTYSAIPQSVYPQTYYTSIADVSSVSIIKPDGEILKQGGLWSSLGWKIGFNHSADLSQVKAYAINLSDNYCPMTGACSFDAHFPQVYISQPPYSGNSYNCSDLNILCTYRGIPRNVIVNGVGVISYNQSQPNSNLVIDTSTTPGGVQTQYLFGLTDLSKFDVTRGSSLWHYEFVSVNSSDDVRSATRTNPDGTVDKFTFYAGTYLSRTDALNRTTSYTWSGRGNFGGRAKIGSITLPDGEVTKYTYNEGNLIEVRKIAAPGSGLPDVVVTETYPTSCANRITCHKPTQITDARGKSTDYTYDQTHGGMLTETGPADSNGVRPQKRYSYTQLYPKILDASGNLVNSTPVWRLTKISECLSATAANPASCVGTAAERVTTFAYNSNNLFRTSESVAAGDGSLSVTTTYTYDDIGNLVAVDGPRTDVDDMSYTTYDVLRRPVYEIGVDPDGTGILKRAIVKHNYDVDGREYLTQTGTGSAITFVNGIPTDVTDFTVTSFKRNTYDATTGLLTKTEVGQP